MLFGKKTLSKGPIDYIVAGLGNPGKEYDLTRHNSGFMAVDNITDKLNVKADRVKFKSLSCEAQIGEKRILFLKPSTFMNLSGEAVVAAMDFYKVPIENVIVIFDDISLEPGKLRIRQKGSHGGHNGIKSIVMLTGSENFPRIKIGVGAKPHPDYDLAKWVLSKFTANEQKELKTALDCCYDIISLITSGDMAKAMNKYNG